MQNSFYNNSIKYLSEEITKEPLVKKIVRFENLTPFIIAVFPILSLALENIEFIHFISILRSILISCFVASIFYLLFYLFLREQRKSAILSSLLIFILLTYGNVYIYIENQLGAPPLHRNLLGIYAVLYFLIGAYLIFRVKNIKELNSAILTGGLAILIYLLVSIGFYQYKVFKSGFISENSSNPFSSDFTEGNTSNLPDIYLILLDGHTRSDILKDVYDFDNSEFINQLENLGFWVADCAKSNYPGTNFSIKSLFEMDYLHTIYKDIDNLVFPPLNNTSVFRILNNNNYSTVTFNNFVFEHFNIKDDIRLTKENNQFGSINEFEKMVIDNSILRILNDLEDVFPYSWLRPFREDFFLTHYRDTQYALETLPKLPEINQPLFVYAHLLVTHDPFVFLPDGSFNPSENFTEENYKNAVEYIGNVLPDIVEEIIENSEKPPIIIIMGDHGATIKGSPIEERVSILFAINYQGEVLEGIYENISPVNVFRLIFNSLFDSEYELLKDKSYEIWSTPDLRDLYKRIYPPCNP